MFRYLKKVIKLNKRGKFEQQNMAVTSKSR